MEGKKENKKRRRKWKRRKGKLYHTAAKRPGPKADLQNGSKDVPARWDNK